MHLVVWLGAILATWPVALHGLATEAWTRWPADAARCTVHFVGAPSGERRWRAKRRRSERADVWGGAGVRPVAWRRRGAWRDASGGVAWRHVASRRALV
jgi:hypothetical protein